MATVNGYRSYGGAYSSNDAFTWLRCASRYQHTTYHKGERESVRAWTRRTTEFFSCESQPSPLRWDGRTSRFERMSSKPNGSPPPYDDGFHGSRELYVGDVPPQPAYSYYPDDEFLHFYRWSSPPGIIKIVSVIIIVLCVAIFACVASTLAWDTQMGLGGFGGIGGGRRRFYLAIIIICAILAFLMFIATIVYLVAVNPMAQSSGSIYASQIQGLCAQYQRPQVSGVFVNQYLYHYCVVEPQEAIAIVFGFLVTIGLIILLVFAVLTRKKMINRGKQNVLWERVKTVEETQPEGIEEWVNNVSEMPDGGLSNYPVKLADSRSHLDDDSYAKPPDTPEVPAEEVPLQSVPPYSSGSELPSSVAKPKKRRARRPRADGQEYDTDYNTGAESADELDDNDFDREFPPIYNEQERSDYKRWFDQDHQEYKSLQAELDSINKDLSAVDRELDDLEEGSPQYLDALDEYDRLKGMKRSSDYQTKKYRCKYLKTKLNHIKKRVSEFDRS
ncbi:hypothetical protein SKAU_G00358920 [Synaphobranchus kaupii]|uniref:Occludin n=1 Tax=Synaphobranchus kaupii TaxID=118154 RepID=A0A9Q1IGX1_SYNKA|nr:hypothetical protein SKAU_G00358920 [Synaphobranchus kaupii]